jgi:transcriptional regulator with XRE-family HTH domain
MARGRRKLRIFNVSLMAHRQACKGLDNGDLARQANLSPSTIGRLMAGKTQSLQTVKAVAGVLGFELSELMEQSAPLHETATGPHAVSPQSEIRNPQSAGEDAA